MPALLVRIVNNTYLHGADTRVRTAVVVTVEREKNEKVRTFSFSPLPAVPKTVGVRTFSVSSRRDEKTPLSTHQWV
jgi:hypothetical protein